MGHLDGEHIDDGRLDEGTLRHGRHDVGGTVLHAVEAGPADGPAVVLLHGFPEFWYGWRRQIGPLAAAGYRVVVPDQRGYNASDRPEGIESLSPEVPRRRRRGPRRRAGDRPVPPRRA